LRINKFCQQECKIGGAGVALWDEVNDMMDDKKAQAPKSEPCTLRTMGIVRCNNYGCLGLKERDGVWRDLHGNPLDVIDVVDVVEMVAEF